MHRTPSQGTAPEVDEFLETIVGAGYRPVASIGVGGMGVVYRAWDHTADRYVVLKVPHRTLLVDPSFRERFDREMEAARRLAHAHVVPVLDFGLHDGLPYAILQYMAGGTLDRRRPTHARAPVPAPSAFLHHWLVPVAEALDHVHGGGYVHRDVKPANILFDGRGRPHLGDFGIAKAIRQIGPADPGPGLTATGFAIGTPEYMAPELVLGRRADGRADQYSLAVVVFEFLTARLPIVAATPSATMVAQATQPAPDLRTIRPELPASLCAAVGRALAKDPERRFETCREFVELALAEVAETHRDGPVRLVCPGCGGLIGVQPGLAGRRGKCPQCAAVVGIAADLESIIIPEDAAPRRRPARRGDPPGPVRRRGRLPWTVLAVLVTVAALAVVWCRVGM